MGQSKVGGIQMAWFPSERCNWEKKYPVPRRTGVFMGMNI
jgi:hypothetical protein